MTSLSETPGLLPSEKKRAASGMIWISGQNALCTWFGDEWLKFRGRTMEQELGNGWANGVHPEDLDRCLDVYLSHFRAREPFQMEYRLLRYDGQYRWVLDQGVPNIDPESGFKGFIGSCIDIHERHQAETRYRAMIDLSPQGFWASALDGQITYCNTFWRAYTGLGDEEIVGFDWNLLVHPDDRDSFHSAWNEASNIDGPYEVEMRFRRYDGHYEWFLVKSAVQVGDSGQPSQRIVIAINTELRHQAEDALRRTEKLAAVGRLAASIAHEINNPLEAVVNLLYLMRNEASIPLLRKYLNEAEHELGRVSQIVTETLKFHRQQTSPALANVAEIIESALKLFQGRLLSAGIRTRFDIGKNTSIICHAGEIRQVMMNLIGNAADAMPKGGELRIRVHSNRDGSAVNVLVGDNGMGIDKDVQQNMFEAFFTTKSEKGTGLGLWVTNEIIRRHHGRLLFRTTTNGFRRGSIFLILLSGAGSTQS